MRNTESTKDNFGMAEITTSTESIKKQMVFIGVNIGKTLEIQPQWPYWILLYYALWHSDLKLSQKEKNELWIFLVFLKHLNIQWEKELCKVKHNLSKQEVTIFLNAISYLESNELWL